MVCLRTTCSTICPKTSVSMNCLSPAWAMEADVKLADSLVSELPSKDGVSIPLQPTVRTTILVILAQLARSAGSKQKLSVHPATNDGNALRDLVETLSREGMPSRDRVIAFDLEPVSFDMESVPLDELLQFRAEHQAEHRAYMRDLRGFMAELADVNLPEESYTAWVPSNYLQRKEVERGIAIWLILSSTTVTNGNTVWFCDEFELLI